MAKQHFYSCVPARMSIFNKMDGYDTFFYSDGISREMIENELSKVYDNKPAKEDAVLIRDGALPPVYCQFETAEGSIVQSAVSFIKSDYTGERSAYMVHSLLLSQEEEKQRFESLDSAVFNPDVFKKDLSGIDLNSPDLKPDSNYPELKVPTKKAMNVSEFAENYDTGTIKRIIFSVISIICGKTKALYLGLPFETETFSEECLKFINGILQIFPYHMRKQISFVTYIGDTTKFQGFKIKGIKEETPAVPVSKGITIKMGIKEFTGVGDDVIAANAVMVDFFYGLLSNEEIRKEFIDFCEYAVEKNPALRKTNLKTLGDLILMFRYLSGFYSEKTVIPNDDAVYNFVYIYDKNRDALKNEYRARAMKCLERYPATHTAIPKNVFSRVSGIYSTETEESKSVIMSVVLELIHTDVMRDKLFSFIKQYYDDETPELKKIIMQNVCSVYYGGFLQEHILEFFKSHFENEPADVRSMILEKLFLTVRTPKIQKSVIGFVDEYYELLNKEEKAKFYEIVYEMIPEGDALSRLLADAVDAHIEEERKEEFSARLIKAVTEDEKSKKPKLASVLCTKCGFCEGVIAKEITSSLKNTAAEQAFITDACEKPIKQIAETVKELFIFGTPDSEFSEKFLSALSAKLNIKEKFELFEVIEAIDLLIGFKSENASFAAFGDRLIKESLLPLLSALLPNAFEFKKYPNGVERISSLASERDYLIGLKEYEDVKNYIEAIEHYKDSKPEAMFESLIKISDKKAKIGASVLFKKGLNSADEDSVSDEMLFSSAVAVESLKSDELKIDDAVNTLKNRYMANLRVSEPKADAQVLSEKADILVFEKVFDILVSLYLSAIPEECKTGLVAENSDVERYFTSLAQKHGKKAKKIFSEKSAADIPEPIKQCLNKAISVKSQGGGIFKKLFKK